MKLHWTEPWLWHRVRRNLREAAEAMPHAKVISIFGGGLTFVAMLWARYAFPGSEDVLAWDRIAFVSLIGAAFVWLIFLPALFPYTVHIFENRVFFQMGSGGANIKCEQMTAIAFETIDGVRCFVIRHRTKKGKAFRHIAALSPEVSESDIRQFLFDIGLADLLRSEP